jgi:hypothetical protein
MTHPSTIILVAIVVLYLCTTGDCEFWRTFRRERANSCIQVNNLGELDVDVVSTHVYTFTAKFYGKKYWNTKWLSIVLGINGEQYQWKVYSKEHKLVHSVQWNETSIVSNHTIVSRGEVFGFDKDFLHAWIRVENITLPVEIENTTLISVELITPVERRSRASVTNFLVHRIYECDNWKSPQKQMEIYRVFLTDAFRITYVGNVLVICLGVILFCNLLYFRKSQMVRSRRYCYFVGCISLIIYEITDLLESLNRAEILERTILAIYMITIFIPTLTFCLMIVRYYYMKNMYSILQSYDHILGNNMFELHRRLTFRKVFIGTIVTVTLLFIIGVIVLLAAMKNLEAAQLCNLVVQVTCNFGIALIAILAAVADFIYRRRMIKEKGIKFYIFSDDPLRIRLEMLFTILLVPVGIVTAIVTLIRNTFHVTEERVPALIVVTVFYESISFVFSIVYMFLLSGGLIISMSWFRKVIGIKDRKVNEERLEDLLLDQVLEEMLRNYCLNEFSIENYMLYTDLKRLKHSDSVTLESLKQLFNVYFSSVSFLQVNLPGNTVQIVSKQISEMEEKKEEKCSTDILEPIWRDALVNLTDTYSRLCVTAEYKQYMKVRKVTRELYKVSSQASLALN